VNNKKQAQPPVWREVQEKTGMRLIKKQNSENCQQFNAFWFILIMVLGSLLTACNAIENGNPTTPGATAPATQPSKSNKLAACALLSKTEVEKILGQTVESVGASRMTEGTDATAAASQCSYRTTSAQTVEFFARRSPVADNTPEAIQRVRDTLKDITQKTPLDVAGVGDAAFWTTSRQLHVFTQGNLYFYVSMMNFKDEADAKAKAIELTRQVLAKPAE
jgi:hypothetical protein